MFSCMIYGEDHYMKECPHHDEVTKFLKGTSQLAILTDPFPPPQQKMVAQNPTPPKGGNAGHPPPRDASSSAHVLMCAKTMRKRAETSPKMHL